MKEISSLRSWTKRTKKSNLKKRFFGILFYCNTLLISVPQYRQFLLSLFWARPQVPQTMPFAGRRILFVLANMHSNLSSNSNSEPHLGHLVLPDTASIQRFSQQVFLAFRHYHDLNRISAKPFLMIWHITKQTPPARYNSLIITGITFPVYLLSGLIHADIQIAGTWLPLGRSPAFGWIFNGDAGRLRSGVCYYFTEFFNLEFQLRCRRPGFGVVKPMSNVNYPH